jgi:hypothetical protein
MLASSSHGTGSSSNSSNTTSWPCCCLGKQVGRQVEGSYAELHWLQGCWKHRAQQPQRYVEGAKQHIEHCRALEGQAVAAVFLQRCCSTQRPLGAWQQQQAGTHQQQQQQQYLQVS